MDSCVTERLRVAKAFAWTGSTVEKRLATDVDGLCGIVRPRTIGEGQIREKYQDGKLSTGTKGADLTIG